MNGNIYITLSDGKYEYEFDHQKGAQTIKRNGKDWRDETGDNLILAMAQRIDELEEEVYQLECDAMGDDL